MPSSQSGKIQRYFEIDIEAALEELQRAAEEEPFAPPAVLANVAKLSGWNDPPDVVIVTPVSNKWEWQDGGFFLGNADGTGAIIFEPGTYDIPLTGIVVTVQTW